MEIFYILFVIFFFGLCIFVHELGHLLMALRCGLHVERFSIGFGPKLWGCKIKGVEYIVSLLPFGGYVMIPQLEPVEKPKTEDGQELPVASPKARILAAVAGPVANIIFGFVLAAVVMAIGLHRTIQQDGWYVHSVPQVAEPMPAEIGMKRGDAVVSLNGTRVHGNWGDLWARMTQEDLLQRQGMAEVVVKRKTGFLGLFGPVAKILLPVTPRVNPEYAAGLRAGDRIVKINGKPFLYTYEKVVHALTLDDDLITLTVVRDGQEVVLKPYRPLPNPRLYGLPFPFMDLDRSFLVAKVVPGSSAEKAGVKEKDDILSVNDKKVTGMDQFQDLIGTSAGQPVELLVQRKVDQQIQIVRLAPITAKAIPRIGVVLTPTTDGETCSTLVDGVSEKSAAEKAGIKKGDLITAVNGTPVHNNIELNHLVQGIGEAPLTLTIKRDGQELQLPNIVPVLARDDTGRLIYDAGGILTQTKTELYNPNPWEQFVDVASRTAQTFRALIAGRVRPKDFSGPLGILQMTYIKVTVDQFRGGLSFIVLITFSLGFFNLLPLPVLDGGHISFAAIELLIRRRLPIKILEWLYTAFAILLIGFMLYVTLYDIGRILDMTGLTERVTEVDEP